MIGILFIARLGSTRLEQKNLIEANGTTFMECLVNRFQHTFQKEIENGVIKLIIATSDEPENRRFDALFAYNSDVSVYYGNKANIPLRQLECALDNNLSHIISIDGDDTLCSTEAAVQIKVSVKSWLINLCKKH